MLSIFEIMKPNKFKIKRFPNSLASISRISRPPIKISNVNALRPNPKLTHSLYSKYTRRGFMKMR